jgi:hypothetical protein
VFGEVLSTLLYVSIYLCAVSAQAGKARLVEQDALAQMQTIHLHGSTAFDLARVTGGLPLGIQVYQCGLFLKLPIMINHPHKAQSCVSAVRFTSLTRNPYRFRELSSRPL